MACEGGDEHKAVNREYDGSQIQYLLANRFVSTDLKLLQKAEETACCILDG